MALNLEGKSTASLHNEDSFDTNGLNEGGNGKGVGSVGDGDGDDTVSKDVSDCSGPKSGGDGEEKCQGEKKKSNQPPMMKIWRKEEDVGITEYLGTHDGFSAVIKQRYSDFHVHEVNAQGEVIHLTDESVPDPPKEKEQIVTEGAPACISEEKIAEINHMVDINSKISKENEIEKKDKEAEKIPNEVLIKVDGLEKQERTSIHIFIKTNYKNIVSSTKEINGEKYIQVRSGKCDDRWDKKTPWPKSQRYTYFVLYKENMDTMDAISKIAFKLRMKPAMFSYAGTKDKRGKTSQLVSVPEVPPQRLYNITKDDWAINVGNFSFQHKPLKLGQLSGNRFKLVLRKISVSDEAVNKAVENLKGHGFINYYGMQRFGTTCVSTHSIGRALLQGNWSEAINLILSPRSEAHGEQYFMNMALQEYHKGGNAKEALHKLNDCYKGSSLEAQLLRGISECDKHDLVGALSRLPRNMRSFYLHAYQSFIWNSIVSKRIKEYGLRVLPGDLVRQRQSASSKEKLLEDVNETIDAEDSTALVEVLQEETADDDSENKKNVDIHVLTAEEANSTDITQILLPLPGHDILLPENEIKNWYVEMLEKDGLSLEKLQHKVKAYSVSGVYRRLLVRPSDVSHFITYYNDASKPLVQSDKEKLNGEDVENNKLKGFPGLAEGKPYTPMDVDGPLPSIPVHDTNLDAGTNEPNQSTDKKEKSEGVNDESNTIEGSEGGCGEYAQQRADDMTKGRMKALILELTLPASSYATMALRELLKIDTATHFQNNLDTASGKVNLGRDSGNFGNRGRDSGNFRNRGRDSSNFRKRGHDSGNFRNRGRDSGNFGKRGRDSGNFGKRRGNYGGPRKRGRF